MNGESNRVIIRTNKWFSSTGFIDLELIDDLYFKAIKEQWLKDRKKILDKYFRVEKHLEKNYESNIKIKNARRLTKVKIYDLLIKQEDLRRRMRLIFNKDLYE